MKKYYVFLDAECDGLYGRFISVAMVVIDNNGHEVDRMYKGIKKNQLLNSVESLWVRENVLPVMKEYDEVDNENELIEAVWAFWMNYQKDAYMIVDVGYPVEARLLMNCVQNDPKTRIMQAPFPLLDLSSMLYAKRQDPLMDRSRFSKDVLHNPLTDVDISIKIWKK
ncbi:hypothetical protein P261_00104 [Lachnospiraceae bacterium TWA4]|nr:hypothetical protein P261_00104 [Lachnospiraceae bacterium TWA4]